MSHFRSVAQNHITTPSCAQIQIHRKQVLDEKTKHMQRSRPQSRHERAYNELMDNNNNNNAQFQNQQMQLDEFGFPVQNSLNADYIDYIEQLRESSKSRLAQVQKQYYKLVGSKPPSVTQEAEFDRAFEQHHGQQNQQQQQPQKQAEKEMDLETKKRLTNIEKEIENKKKLLDLALRTNSSGSKPGLLTSTKTQEMNLNASLNLKPVTNNPQDEAKEEKEAEDAFFRDLFRTMVLRDRLENGHLQILNGKIVDDGHTDALVEKYMSQMEKEEVEGGDINEKVDAKIEGQVSEENTTPPVKDLQKSLQKLKTLVKKQLSESSNTDKKPRKQITKKPSTIPTPFDFKPSTKTTSMKRLEEDMAKAALEEKKVPKFKARDPPKSSLMSKYDEVMAKIHENSRIAREKRLVEVVSKIRPFKFVEKPRNDLNKKHEENCPAHQHKLEKEKETAAPKKSYVEKRPVSAKSLPESRLAKMAIEDGRKRIQKLKYSETHAGLTENHTFKPKLNHDVPDFNKLQQEFADRLAIAKEKAQRKTSEAKPFVFKSDERLDRRSSDAASPTSPKRKNSILDEDYELKRPVPRWPFMDERQLPDPEVLATYNLPPPKETKSHELRVQYLLQKEEERQLLEETVVEQERQRRERASNLAERLRVALEPRDQAILATKVSHNGDFKRACKEREEWYQGFLQHVKQKMEDRELIVDRELVPPEDKHTESVIYTKKPWIF